MRRAFARTLTRAVLALQAAHLRLRIISLQRLADELRRDSRLQVHQLLNAEAQAALLRCQLAALQQRRHIHRSRAGVLL